jgi:Uma2 family endonuclease
MAMLLAHHRFTADEYHRMAQTGILTEEDRVELLDGEIIQVTPIGPRHANCVDQLNRLLAPAVSGKGIVRVQGPIRLAGDSEPEPEIAVLRERALGYGDAHPAPVDVLLVVEVADNSIGYDRARKVPAYARAGIPEVWLVDLTENRIEVYREPEAEGRYRSVQAVGRDATLSPLNLPNVTVSTAELLA